MIRGQEHPAKNQQPRRKNKKRSQLFIQRYCFGLLEGEVILDKEEVVMVEPKGV